MFFLRWMCEVVCGVEQWNNMINKSNALRAFDKRFVHEQHIVKYAYSEYVYQFPLLVVVKKIQIASRSYYFQWSTWNSDDKHIKWRIWFTT